MPPDFTQSKQLDQQEHVHEAGAKRVIPRYLNPGTGEYQNVVPELVPNIDYDYIDIQQTNATTETYVYKTGGSGGTTVMTIVIVYTSSAKDNLNTIEYS